MRAARKLCDQVLAKTPAGLQSTNWYEEAIGHSSRFPAFLAQHPKKRIYIAGCGRSGTWLALGMMSTFCDTALRRQEAHFGHFATMTHRPESVHVVKRIHFAWEFLDQVPERIVLLYVIRDPRDVLTSVHRGTENYITIDRWENEMKALGNLLSNGRSNLVVVRYEDMVTDPVKHQQRLASLLELQPSRSPKRFFEGFEVDEAATEGMHGLRPPDANSIGRWRRNPRSVEYIASVQDRIAPWFDRIGRELGYGAGPGEETIGHLQQ